MKMKIKLSPVAREIAGHLTEAMREANASEVPAITGTTYGRIRNALLCLIKLDTGFDAKNVEFNWGGNASWLEDLEIALADVEIEKPDIKPKRDRDEVLTYDERTLFDGEASVMYHLWSDGSISDVYTARRHIPYFPGSWLWDKKEGQMWAHLVYPSAAAAVRYLTKQRKFFGATFQP